MKIAIDFENTLTKKEVFDFANEMLNQGIEVYVLTNRTGHIQSDQNRDILKTCKQLRLSFFNVNFTHDLKGYFEGLPRFDFYLSDNLVNLQLAEKVVRCIPTFGNINWENECLEALKVEV